MKYNLARALHYMGLNANSMELYEQIASMESEEIDESQREIRVRAIFNMSLMMKGGGVATGAAL